MTGLKRLHLGVSVLLALLLLGAPVGDVVAQSRAKKSNRGRSSVRQAHKSRRPLHRPSKPPRPDRPPHQRPPSYRPPRPRPPVYRPHPPRYRGRYYPSYSLWRAAVGAAAVIAIGTILATPPPQSTTVIIKEKTYYLSEGVYYEQVMHGDETAYQAVHDPR